MAVGVYKPACSGSDEGNDGPFWADIRDLSDATENRFPAERICPQRFEAPLAPPVAAGLENRKVDSKLLRDGAGWWMGRTECLLIEGIGGLLCPVTQTETIADLAGDLTFPLLLVGRSGLGTINHTLLTLEVAKQRGLSVAGVVLNQASKTATPARDNVASNAAQIESFGGVKVIGACEFGSTRLSDPTTGEPITTDWLSVMSCAE